MYLQLDRALVTKEWCDHYKDMRVHHLVESTSDHCALLITDSSVSQWPRKRRFKFEAMWTRRDDYRDIIRAVWNDSVNLYNPNGMVMGLRQCVDDLSRWNRSVFGLVPRQIQNKRKALNDLVLRDHDGCNGYEINKLRKEINDLLDCEEIRWQQRSKVNWMSLGDRNTKYFHTKASGRKKKNTISKLMDERGIWRELALEVAEVAISYFENLYRTSHPKKILEVVEAVDPKVSDEMNQFLIKQFTKDEIEAALKQMHPTKSPRPDSMPTIFYQNYWDIVGNDVVGMVLNVLNSNISMTDINKTFITLIPKINNPAKMIDFRPISFCNVIYKLISKVLANRLKLVLPHIISENQSAFLSERLITDNFFIAFELMHYLDHKKDGKDCYMAIKLDMSKAYDRVE